jgi:hypothetical protein
MEFAISPLFLPWRCSICDRREFKFRFINMNPPLRPEDEEEDVEIEVSPDASAEAKIEEKPELTAEETETAAHEVDARAAKEPPKRAKAAKKR